MDFAKTEVQGYLVAEVVYPTEGLKEPNADRSPVGAVRRRSRLPYSGFERRA